MTPTEEQAAPEDSVPAQETVAETAPTPTAEPTEQPAAEAAASAESAVPQGPPGPPDLSPAACAALLAQHFPALFGASRALPIKLRIQADIQQRVPGVFSKKSLSIFLHRYTTSTAYLKALASAPQRLDLDGAPAGEIDPAHREAAATEAQRRKQMFEERRAAEREQQRLAAQEARRQQRQDQPAEQRQDQRQGPRQELPRKPPREAARARPVPHGGAGMPVEARAEVRPAVSAVSPAEAEARRNRAALLRAFETTTLTRANFCALKGIAPADLDAQLAQARQEHEQRAQEPRPEFHARPDQRHERQRGPRGTRTDRPGRPSGKPGT